MTIIIAYKGIGNLTESSNQLRSHTDACCSINVLHVLDCVVLCCSCFVHTWYMERLNACLEIKYRLTLLKSQSEVEFRFSAYRHAAIPS